MRNNVPACDYALDELLEELTETRTLREQNVDLIRSHSEIINELRGTNRQLDLNEAVLVRELERRVRDGDLISAQEAERAPTVTLPVATEPTPITHGKRCVYCSVASSRFVKLEPDGPGKWSCINREQCEERIKRQDQREAS
jgi:hypothetical protein